MWGKGRYEPPNDDFHCDQWTLQLLTADSADVLVRVNGPSSALRFYQVFGGRKEFADLESAQRHAVKIVRPVLKRIVEDALADLAALEKFGRVG